MSIWSKIRYAFEALSEGKSLSEVFETFTKPPEKTLAFTIAVIGLGAKMAKADGRVTRDEVTAFRQVFFIEPQDEAHAARIFNLAKEDVAGFQTYARSIARMFSDNKAVLVDLLEGLFYIASADGVHHPLEEAFLEEVSDIFELDQRDFNAIKNRAIPGSAADPYMVLGVDPDDDLATIRKKWRQIVKETHPDRMIARGVPTEAVELATHRLASVNEAWEKITNERKT